jgi:mono/diheme cytochrome c family protein
MARLLRWAAYAVGALLLLLLLAAAWVWFASSSALSAPTSPHEEQLATPTAEQLADGPRQLRTLGCVSCHGEGLRGKLFFNEPMVAVIHAPNIALLARTADDQQLARAIRQGVGHDGRPLFVMPSATYSRLNDGQVAALIHAIRALPPGGRQMPGVAPGPVGRLGIATGKFRTAPEMVEDYRNAEPLDAGPATAAGRKLAMTSCSECHGADLGGAEPKPGEVAPDLKIAAAYDLAMFKHLLRTGEAAGGRKLQLMREVALGNYRYLTDKEIEQLHAYLVERAQRAP